MKRLALFLATIMACSIAQAADCMRNTPSPLFDAGRRDVQDHHFTLTSSHEAMETFRMGVDTDVRVAHGGCEYIVATFRFTAPGLFAHQYADADVYAAAAGLIAQLKQTRPELNFDLDGAGRTLSHEAQTNLAPALERGLPIDGDGIPPMQAMLVVHAAGPDTSRDDVEVTFFRGL